MASFRTLVIDGPADAERRLAAFGLTKAQILEVRDSARAAAEDASPLMPINAPGHLAYIHGVGALRQQLLDGEWKIDRTLGVEAVISQERGIRIGFQNVDKACDAVFGPMPRSAKGAACERMCSLPLFDHYGVILDMDQDRLPMAEMRDPLGEHLVTFFVMVGEDGSVELSSPIVSGGRFTGFRERIFVDWPEGDWEDRIEQQDIGPADDFDVPVSLKSKD